MDAMKFIPILLVGFAASLGFTPVSRQIAMRLGVVDKPNQRKIHHDHKPMMDGLTAGFTAIAAGYFVVIAFSQGLTLVTSLAAALAGSAVGFLIYNFNPASVFMGDMGALVLGFILAVLGIKLKFGTQPLNVTWMVPILVLALPLFDILLVVITRIMEGRSPAQAGKDHTSHRLISI